MPSWAARWRAAALQWLVETMTAFAPFPPKRSRRMASSIERFGLDIADLAADEQWDDPSRRHHIDLVGYAPMSQNVIPADDGTADHIPEDTRLQTDFVDIQLQYAAHVAQPGARIQVPETEGHGLPGTMEKRAEKADALQFRRASSLAEILPPCSPFTV